MKRVTVFLLLVTTFTCFGQQSASVPLQMNTPQIEAIREQARAIGQANIDRQRASLPENLLTPKANAQEENKRLETLKIFNTLRQAQGLPPIQ